MTGILLVGRTPDEAAKLTEELEADGVQLFGVMNADEVLDRLEHEAIDLVVVAGVVQDADRHEICTVIASIRDELCIHLKDRASGPEGMLPFLRGIIKGFT